MRRRHALGLIGAAAGGAALAPGRGARADLTDHGFNAAQIPWRQLQDGLVAAGSTGAPIFMLVHATWCPACEAFRERFFDPRAVALLTRFTPVIVDQDEEPRVSRRYAPDGEYVPRCLTLHPDGRIRADVTGPRPDYKFFIDPSDDWGLLDFLAHASA